MSSVRSFSFLLFSGFSFTRPTLVFTSIPWASSYQPIMGADTLPNMGAEVTGLFQPLPTALSLPTHPPRNPWLTSFSRGLPADSWPGTSIFVLSGWKLQSTETSLSLLAQNSSRSRPWLLKKAQPKHPFHASVFFPSLPPIHFYHTPVFLPTLVSLFFLGL